MDSGAKWLRSWLDSGAKWLSGAKWQWGDMVSHFAPGAKWPISVKKVGRIGAKRRGAKWQWGESALGRNGIGAKWPDTDGKWWGGGAWGWGRGVGDVSYTDNNSFQLRSLFQAYSMLNAFSPSTVVWDKIYFIFMKRSLVFTWNSM